METKYANINSILESLIPSDANNLYSTLVRLPKELFREQAKCYEEVIRAVGAKYRFYFNYQSISSPHYCTD